MMVRERPVDLGEEKMVFARKLLRQEFEGGAGGPIAGIPADAETRKARGIDPGQPFDQPVDIGMEDLAAFAASAALDPVPLRRHPAEVLDVFAEERTAKKYHLEAIVIGGIVAASYLNAALHIFG
jgi:hypothetical protein